MRSEGSGPYGLRFASLLASISQFYGVLVPNLLLVRDKIIVVRVREVMVNVDKIGPL